VPVDVAVRLWQFIRRAWSSKTLENTFWVGAASAVSALLGAVSSAFYARSLGVEDFGVLMLIISLVTMMVALSDLGISGSIVRFGAEAVAREDKSRFRSVVAVALQAKLALSGLILVFSLLFLNPIVGKVFTHVNPRIESLFALSLFAVAFGMAAGFFPPLFQSYMRFRTLAIVSVVPPLVKVIALTILISAFGSIALGNAIGLEIGIAAVLFTMSFAFSPRGVLTVFGGDRQLRRQMFSFNKWLSVYYILSLLGGRVDLFFVGGLADARALGLYSSASKIASIVIIVTNSYLTVLLPELSSALTPEMIRKKQRHSMMIVVLFAAGIVLLAAVASPVMWLLYGPAYEGGSLILQIMCVGLLFTVFAYPLNGTLFARNRTVVFPLMSAIGISVLVAANWLLIPRYGAVGAAAAFSLSGCSGFLVSTMVYFLSVRREPA